MAVASARTSSMLGWPVMAPVTASAKSSRLTASALPAGSAWRKAVAMMKLPKPSISFLRMPRARSGKVLPMELLQTNSARRSPVWAAVGRVGRISTRRTWWPRLASCQAASLPASPPPMTVTVGDMWGYGSSHAETTAGSGRGKTSRHSSRVRERCHSANPATENPRGRGARSARARFWRGRGRGILRMEACCSGAASQNRLRCGGNRHESGRHHCEKARRR